jgi:hypothetical protein
VHEHANTLIKQAAKQGNLFGDLANFSWIFPLFLVIIAVFAAFAGKIYFEKKLPSGGQFWPVLSVLCWCWCWS